MLFRSYYQKENNPGAFYKFYRFLNEAIEENYEKTDDPNLADLILHSTLNNRQEIPTHPADKLVILDWSDFDNIITYNCLGYFKKNWSKRSIVNGVCVKKSPTQLKKNYHPLQEMALPTYFLPEEERTIFVSCSLRVTGKGDFPNRIKVLNFLKNCNLKESSIGALHKNKLGIDKWKKENIPNEHIEYLKQLGKSQIVVTCGPSSWEGDSRLWEALASGACVFTDKITANLGPLPIDNQHCFYYDLNDLNSLMDKIDFLKNKEELCRKIGKAGREFALKYHTPKARLEQIINKIKI